MARGQPIKYSCASRRGEQDVIEPLRSDEDYPSFRNYTHTQMAVVSVMLGAGLIRAAGFDEDDVLAHLHTLAQHVSDRVAGFASNPLMTLIPRCR